MSKEIEFGWKFVYSIKVVGQDLVKAAKRVYRNRWDRIAHRWRHLSRLKMVVMVRVRATMAASYGRDSKRLVRWIGIGDGEKSLPVR